MLVIDYREHALIDICKDTSSTENLMIGDIHIRDDSNTLLVIERKTLADLSSSIKDGRWREQKARLMESGCQIMYIIEKCKNKSKLLDKKILDSALINSIFRDGSSVYFTDSPEHTVEIIKMLDKKFTTNEFEKQKSGITSIKKSSKTIDNIFIHQLNTIPGVSINVAIKIQELYKNMKELLNASSSGVNFLENISLGKKKLGKKLSEKIYKCINGETCETQPQDLL